MQTNALITWKHLQAFPAKTQSFGEALAGAEPQAQHKQNSSPWDPVPVGTLTLLAGLSRTA